ncbi:MAG: hypothetical protein IJ661_03980 [Lachnospiraceae bacterium]|nr:hypothetical protein [Lachnospiraceae bacterium]
MAYSTRYGKPSMTNLPPDLGKAIFEQILSTPAPDHEKLRKEAHELEKKMLEIRREEDAKK